MATDQQDAVTETTTAPSGGVGATLKAARQRMGKELADVAQQLRIRQVFLAALEEGRHKDLPGGTYAVGFLRSYAEFLDLDGEELVRQFKQEAAGDLNSRAELVFPSPVSEGRVPGGAVIFLGLLVAALGYGGWYWLSSRNTTIADMIPAVPERMETVSTPASEPPKADEAAKPTEEAAAPAAAESPAPAEQAAAPADAPAPAEQVTPEPEVKPEPEKPAPAAATAPATPAEPAQEAAQAEPAPAPQGTVLGEDNTNARIVLKAATGDCWIQVREMDGQLLMSRLLRHGDSYRVPDRPGLTLMVGDAGALEIIVDGKTVPSLGASGQVRRDIKLDPEKLI